jgi:hypothetical protein
VERTKPVSMTISIWKPEPHFTIDPASQLTLWFIRNQFGLDTNNSALRWPKKPGSVVTSGNEISCRGMFRDERRLSLLINSHL